jgi:hypothetical protein
MKSPYDRATAVRKTRMAKAYRCLSHAILHCKWGGEVQDRTADAGDNGAIVILAKARRELTDELAAEFTDWQGA